MVFGGLYVGDPKSQMQAVGRSRNVHDEVSKGASDVSARTLREGGMGAGETCPYLPFPPPVTGTKMVKVCPEAKKKID